MTEKIAGAFIDSLTRTGKEIKNDRAEELHDGAFIQYKRIIEDLEMSVKNLTRQRKNMLDLSPTTVTSLQLAADFKPEEFVKDDIKLSMDIRNLTIQLDIAKKRYKFLFAVEGGDE